MSEPVKIGNIMYDTETNITFRVLCNCGGSRPREHTERYVNAHPERFAQPTQAQRDAFVDSTLADREAIRRRQHERRKQQPPVQSALQPGQSVYQQALQRMRQAGYTRAK